ncbi:MAG: hypothetical protein JOZ25_04290 [Actinobacteria bacterium]|nr:hypothetical protein [Actinomycetota bacterium]
MAAALLAMSAAVVGCGGSAGERRNARPGPPGSRIVLIVMENKSYTDVIGSRQAPYLDRLANRAAVPAAMYGVGHPSLINYLALIGGHTFGIHVDCTGCHVRGPNLADQMDSAAISWKAYMQGMPRPCYHGAFAGRYPPDHGGLLDTTSPNRPDTETRGYGRRYAKKHDPFMYFDDISGNPSRCSKVVPYSQLATDLRTGRLPTFAFISPDLCNDMHDCVVRAGDAFLASVVPKLLPRLGPQGFLVITFDEGRTNRTCCGDLAKGGRIPTLILGPNVLPGASGTAQYSHYSTLRTIEDAFGLPRLAHAADPHTHSLNPLFSTPPRIVRSGP